MYSVLAAGIGISMLLCTCDSNEDYCLPYQTRLWYLNLLLPTQICCVCDTDHLSQQQPLPCQSQPGKEVQMP